VVSSRLRIGTSGFSYRDWLGNFYPQFCPQADFLKFYASQFATVELDVSYYRIPAEAMVKRWVEVTPSHFVFAAKFPRTVTHEGDRSARLEAAAEFASVMRGLGPKLGPLLLQFPYSFKPDQRPLLETIIDSVPTDLRLSVEVRNRNWLCEDFYALLKRRNVSLCLVDHPWMPRLAVQTADFHYVRFLGDRKKISEDFSYVRNERTDDLAWWSDLLKRFSGSPVDIYAYFNNHYSGHAPTSAVQLQKLMESGS